MPPPANALSENAPSAPGEDYPTPAEYTQLVFTSYTADNWEIYGVVNPWYDKSVRYANRVTNDSGTDILPRLRPGTTQIAFASDRSGEFDIYMINWNGSNLVRLTDHPAYDSQPAWSPDGSRITFVSERDGNLEIYVMQADGSGLTRLTNDISDDFNPYWSPDGSYIIWVRALDQQNGVLYAMNVDGSNPHTMSTPLRYLQHPSISKNGARIAFDYDANQDGWNDIGVMNIDGSNLRNAALGSNLIDYWAGSWTWIERRELLYSKVTYVLDQGHYYIQNSCIGSLNLLESIVDTCYHQSVDDLYPDAEKIDVSPPETHIEPLVAYQRAGVFPVTVAGATTGLAPLYAMYAEARQGATGAWTQFGTTTFETRHTFNYAGSAGNTYYFRSRGWDWADNWEPWPTGDGDTLTNIYTFQLDGQVTDNRDHGISNAVVTTSPTFSDQADAALDGRFHRYVPVSPVTLNASQPGYGALLPATIASSSDIQEHFVLPPLDNAIVNGNFETDLASWTRSGISSFQPTSNRKAYRSCLCHFGSVGYYCKLAKYVE